MRRKNLLLLFLDFLPHLSFAIAAALGQVRLGTYLGLGLALITGALTIRVRKGVAPLVLFNLLFFCIAAAASLLMGRDLEKRLPNLMAGEYAVLLIMGAYTLLEGRPLFLDFASRDYPESMFYNPLFRRTCLLLTWLWCLFFGAGLGLSLFALLFMRGSSSRALPSLASAGGLIILTTLSLATVMLMPGIVGRRLLAASPLQGAWGPASLEVGRSLRESEFDVVVVGGGVGGMVCASLLARSGAKVLLVEQNRRLGGCCAAVSREGFSLNLGPTFLTGTGAGGSLRLFLETVGVADRLPFTRPSLGVIAEDLALLIPEKAETFMDKLASRFPGSEEALFLFLAHLRSFRGELNDRKEPGLPVLVEDLEDFNEQFYAYPISSKWHNQSAAEMLGEYFGHSKMKPLQELFSGMLFPVGGNPAAMSAYEAACLFKELLLDGCGFPVGGLHHLLSLMSETCRGLGVAVLNGNRVENIMLKETSEGPAIVGVKLEDGSQFRSGTVVLACSPLLLREGLLPPGALSGKYLKRLGAMSLSPSFYVLFLGIRGDLEMPDRVFLTTRQPRRVRTGDTYLELRQMTISLLSRRDPSLAPPGCHLLVAWVPVWTPNFPAFTDEGGRRGLEEAMALAVKQELRRLVPHLDERVVFQERITPFHLNRLTSNPYGAAFGFLPSPEQHLFRRPDIRTPLRNLYLVGAWSRYGLGLEGAVVNAMLAARHILGGVSVTPGATIRTEEPLLD